MLLNKLFWLSRFNYKTWNIRLWMRVHQIWAVFRVWYQPKKSWSDRVCRCAVLMVIARGGGCGGKRHNVGGRKVIKSWGALCAPSPVRHTHIHKLTRAHMSSLVIACIRMCANRFQQFVWLAGRVIPFTFHIHHRGMHRVCSHTHMWPCDGRSFNYSAYAIVLCSADDLPVW